MEPGEVWFLNVTFPHQVRNCGERDRIHLVVDCSINDWIRSLLPSEYLVDNWRRLLAYKVRAARFFGIDLWRSIITKDKTEFDRYVHILAWEFHLTDLKKVVDRGFESVGKVARRL
jgi:hypothetical protein